MKNPEQNNESTRGTNAAVKEETQRKVDFKMVTFALSGKLYGIDIMMVKEISKAVKFTYVPNAPAYVRGVYNLRGDIISIIDLRVMFNLPAEKKQDQQFENIIILRLGEYIIGIVVDSIHKVAGFSNDDIQPSHPLFGDINIQYIRGVVEQDENLYIILDVQRIFSQQDESDDTQIEYSRDETKEVEDVPVTPAVDTPKGKIELKFIAESLAALKNFYIADLNRKWAIERSREWIAQAGKANKEYQITEIEDAEEFLSDFYSPYTEQLWEGDCIKEFEKVITDLNSSSITVWNLGCGKGYETYSMACVLKKTYPEAAIRIWASDHDLLKISTAPGLVVKHGETSAYYDEFLEENNGKLQFNKAIQECIMFEYHDMYHSNPFKDLDMIVVRDLASFVKPAKLKSQIEIFYEKLKDGGALVLGRNENGLAQDEKWKTMLLDSMSVYVKEVK